MHHTRKKKALGLIGEEKDPVTITKLLLDNQFTDEEASEIIAGLSSDTETPSDESPAEDSGTAPAKEPAKEISKTSAPAAPGSESKYKEFDQWQVDITRQEKPNPYNPREKIVEIESFTAIKQLRKKVKLEESVVRDLNAQSHNSLRRYYLSGSITNGHNEKVNITTAAN